MKFKKDEIICFKISTGMDIVGQLQTGLDLDESTFEFVDLEEAVALIPTDTGVSFFPISGFSNKLVKQNDIGIPITLCKYQIIGAHRVNEDLITGYRNMTSRIVIAQSSKPIITS